MSTASSLLTSLFSSLGNNEAEATREFRKVWVDCRPSSNLDSLVRSIAMGLLQGGGGDEEVDFTLVSLSRLYSFSLREESPP